MSATGQGPDKAMFGPRKGASRSIIFQLCTFALFTALGFVVLFMNDPDISGATKALVPFQIVFFGAFTVFTILRLFASRRYFVVDGEGLHEVGGKNRSLRWSEVVDIDLVHPLGGLDELQVIFTDRTGKQIKIRTEPLVHGGRTFVDELQTRIPHLFEAKARQYLSGQKTWAMPPIKNLVMLSGDMLFVEYPAGKRQAIPVASLRRLEWVPGAISGARKGYILIEHTGGRIEFPQLAPGIQFFLFTMKHLYRLGDRVNPRLPEATTETIEKKRLSQTWTFAARVLGIALPIATVVLYAMILSDQLDVNTARRIGKDTTGTVIDKRKASLRIQYKTEEGKELRKWAPAEREFAEQTSVGDEIDIRYHPTILNAIWFEQIQNRGATFYIILTSVCLALVIGGIALFWWSFRKQKRDEKVIASLEQAILQRQPPPVPAVPAPVAFTAPLSVAPLPVAPPAPQPQSFEAGTAAALAVEPPPPAASAPAPVITRQCSTCGGGIAGNYYLAAGKPVCERCRMAAGDGPRKPTFLVLLGAALFGGLGALVAGGLWATVTLLTGYELGIVAIFVGLIVGLAVKFGAKGYSGRSLQFVALILTFYALAYAVIPVALIQIKKDPEMSAQLKKAWEDGLADVDKKNNNDEFKELRRLTMANDSEASISLADDESALPDMTDDDAEGEPEEVDPEDAAMEDDGTTVSATGYPSLRQFTADPDEPRDDASVSEDEDVSVAMAFLGLGLIIVGGIVALIFGPVVIYILILVSAPLSFLFLAIALWEAWRVNRPNKAIFTGPYVDQPAMDFSRAEFHR